MDDIYKVRKYLVLKKNIAKILYLGHARTENCRNLVVFAVLSIKFGMFWGPFWTMTCNDPFKLYKETVQKQKVKFFYLR